MELVRYGIRKPDDSLIVDSLQVIDQVLKVNTPYGPCWRRYTHDGYGQCDDGSPFVKAGKGRAWPLLTGERAHYELALGKNIDYLVKAMEGFSDDTCLLPEQVWDAPDLPQGHMFLGKSTGSARPLMWAHAEYIRLLRSLYDGRVFDKIAEVENRYLLRKEKKKNIEIWQQNHQFHSIKKGHNLRIQMDKPFKLKYVYNGQESEQIPSSQIFDIYFININLSENKINDFKFKIFYDGISSDEEKYHEIKIIDGY